MSKLSRGPLDRITAEINKLTDRINDLLSENAKLKREIERLKASTPYPLRSAADWLVARGDSEWHKEKGYEWRHAISSGVGVRQFRRTIPTSEPNIVEIPDEIIDRLAYLVGTPLSDIVHLCQMIDNPD